MHLKVSEGHAPSRHSEGIAAVERSVPKSERMQLWGAAPPTETVSIPSLTVARALHSLRLEHGVSGDDEDTTPGAGRRRSKHGAGFQPADRGLGKDWSCARCATLGSGLAQGVCRIRGGRPQGPPLQVFQSFTYDAHHVAKGRCPLESLSFPFVARESIGTMSAS
jgi:hypothetical protein